MLEYTRASINKVVDDLKAFFRYFGLGTQALYIIYLIYAIFAPAGNLTVNIILLLVSVMYFAFSIFAGEDDKLLREVLRRSYAWFKLAVRAFTLGVTVYGIYAATTHITVFSVVLAGLMVVFWILQILIELLVYFVESRVKFVIAGFEADVESFKRPIETVGNFIKKATGREVEEPREPSSYRKKLDKLVLGLRERKRMQREEWKRHRAEEKATKQEGEKTVRSAAKAAARGDDKEA